VRSAPVMVYAVNRASWKSDVLSHTTVNIIICYINGKDAPEPIQVAQHDDVLSKILIKQIVLGNFCRPCRGLGSSDAVAHVDNPRRIGHAVKRRPIGIYGIFLGITSAGDGKRG